MLRKYLKYRKKALQYLKVHEEYNALIHVIGGVGLGIIITNPLANPHPIRWGVVFVGISVLGHLYTLWAKK